jgi:hypothetical protein
MSTPDRPKLHLNENLSQHLAAELRTRYGCDVTSSQELQMVSDPDAVQLIYAASQQRAILTFNVKDFVPLHELYIAEGREHWGIILSNQQPIGVLVRRLVRLLNAMSAEELRNQVIWLNEFK